VLQDIVRSYNHTYHRTIKCEPVNVNEHNEAEIWRTVYQDLFNFKHKQNTVYKEGDYVRVRKSKGTFTKGYEHNYSDQCYRICEVVKSIPITYKISDGQGNILGSFYESELSKIILKD